MMSIGSEHRQPTESERALLTLLLGRTTDPDLGWLEGLLVCDLDDGGMGSLLLIPRGSLSEEGRFGRTVAECEFADTDGILVLVSLNLDQDDRPFELDVWKTDFSPVIDFPTR